MNVDNTKMMDIKNIVLRFGGVVAIQNISFDIFKGEISKGKYSSKRDVEYGKKNVYGSYRFFSE